jgi:hypothetical protein
LARSWPSQLRIACTNDEEIIRRKLKPFLLSTMGSLGSGRIITPDSALNAHPLIQPTNASGVTDCVSRLAVYSATFARITRIVLEKAKNSPILKWFHLACAYLYLLRHLPIY